MHKGVTAKAMPAISTPVNILIQQGSRHGFCELIDKNKAV
jgi:hypothetical protein